MKILLTTLLCFSCGIVFAFAEPVLSINGLPLTLQIGDTLTITASGGTAPYAWSSSHPASVIVTSLNTTDAQVVVVSSVSNVTITVNDSVSNFGSQMISTFAFKTRIENTSFIDGDTAEVRVFYSNNSPLLDMLSADISLPYDTTAFKFIGLNNDSSLTSPMSVMFNQLYDTLKIGVAATIPVGVTNEQLFLKLRFVSKATIVNSVNQTLHFTKFIVNETINGAYVDGTLTVDPIPNYPPVFVTTPSDTTIKEGDVYLKSFFATDANGHTVHYFLTTNPAPANEASIDSITGQFLFTPSFTSANEYVFEISADDGNGLTTQHQLSLSVNNVNLTPSFSPIFPDTFFVKEGIAFSFTVLANDPDLNTVYYSLIGAPGGMTIDSVTGQLSWTPSFLDSGMRLGVIEAHDLFGGSVSHPQLFAVVDSNRTPVFSIVPNDTVIVEGQLYSVSIVAPDPDSDVVKYFIQSGQPPLLTLDSITGLISWTPDNTLAGIYPITIVVTDNKENGTATHSFSITVNNINLAPMITTAIPDTFYLLENQNFSFDMDAIDSDGDLLKYYADSLFPGMTIDSASGLIQWTPNLTQSGTYATTFKAKDPSGSFDFKNAVFVVFNLNQFPVFTSVLPDTTITENQLLAFNYTAVDFDLDTVSFAVLTPLPGLWVSALGNFQWQPSYSQAGIETVIVLAVDQFGGFALDTAVITVTDINNLPQFTKTMPDTSVARFDTLRFHYTGSDPDSQQLSFSLFMSPTGATISSAGDLHWNPPVDANGLFSFIIELTDGFSFVYDTVTVKVFRFGDVSGNGAITSYDAGMILRNEVGAIVIDTVQKRVGNVSGDSTISSTDASLILQYVVGLINTFPGGLGKHSQSSAVFSAFSFRIVPTQTTGEFNLFVTVTKPSQVFGITMSLNFDSSVVIPKQIKQTALTDSMMMSYFFPKGKANLALAGTKPLNTAGDIAQFTFSIKDPSIAADAIVFTMDRFVLNEKDYAKDIGGISFALNDPSVMPTVFDLKQNYPNPFNPATTISYQLPKESYVTITIYNMIGQIVKTLISTEQSAGYYSPMWNATDDNNRSVSSGVYLYKIIAQSQGKIVFVNTKKMLLLK